ncbi:MAG: phosphopyruvate hydratase [Clostridia bacterium]|nr:phosphopyruvate hydratase [Clostridia bacterium]
MNTITNISGYELLDSRGNPTVAAKVTLSSGASGFAISPSGASTGAHEAHELRDNNTARYGGLGTTKAVENINKTIKKALCGLNAQNNALIDSVMLELDATPNKSNLGANAILAVSLATAKAAANSLKIPLYKYLGGVNAFDLPRPMLNILNGGAHAKNNIDIQEFMIVPCGFLNFSETLRCAAQVYKTLALMLNRFGKSTAVGDEGGFAPDLESDEQAIEFICTAIEKSGYSTSNVKIALDIASSEWYQGNGLYLMPKRGIELNSDALIKMYSDLCKKYPIISIEDGLAEDDWHGWQKLTKALGSSVQLVGDDLFVTNKSRLIKGINNNSANAILIKPNQIGTLTETLEVIRCAKQNNYKCIISHRSGESEDTFISDLAVATNAGQIKTGAPCRTDRTAKYNRLLLIENELIANI